MKTKLLMKKRRIIDCEMDKAIQQNEEIELIARERDYEQVA